MLRDKLALLALLALLGLLYAPTFGHPFLLDDRTQIIGNPAVVEGRPLGDYFFDRSTTSSTVGYNTRVYRPLRNVAFRALYVLGGPRPAVFAAANVLGYFLCALLLLQLLLMQGLPRGTALWTTALWIAAPVHVEAVTYASALGDVLSLVLTLAAILAAAKALSGARVIAWSCVSLALAALAMFTKEMAVTTPLLVGLASVCLPVRALRARTRLALVAAHALVALGYLAIRTHVLGQVGQDPVTSAGLLEGLRSAPVRLIAYARLTLTPIGHSIDYLLPSPSWLAVAAALGALAVVTFFARRDRTLLFGLGWFVAALVPVLQLVPLSADLADRFALVPSVGMALFCAGGAHALSTSASSRLLPFFAGLLLVAYAGGTLLEARTWRSDGVLWRQAVLAEPRSPLAHRNLAGVFLGEGRFDDALRELAAAEALGLHNAQIERARVLALLGLGRTEEAARSIDDAIARQLSDGDLEVVQADVRRRLHDYPGALASLERAIKDGAAARATSTVAGLIALDRGATHDAIVIFARLTREWPDDRDYRGLLTRACAADDDRRDQALCPR